MADGVAITAGSGTTVSTEEITTLNGGAVAAQHVQRAGMALITGNGAAEDITAANPMPVAFEAASTVGIDAGEAHIGEVGGRLAPIRPAMTITAGAYSVGEVIGGTLTLTNAMRVSSGTGMFHGLTLVDKGNVKPELRLILFNAALAGTYTNNNTMTINSADYAKILMDLHIESGDWVTFDDATTDFAIATKAGISMPVAANGSFSLYAVFYTVGAPTFTSTSQLVPTFWFIQN